MSALINQTRNRVPRFAEAAVERARLTVVPRRRTRAARVPFVSLVSLILVGGVAGLLAFNTHMQQASFAATAMEQRADALDAREQSLQMELEKLRDPQRVAVAARAMGMVPPSSPAFLRLADGKVLGDPAPAVAEDAVRVIPLPMPKPRNLRPEPVIVELPAKSQKRDGAADHGRGEQAGTNDDNAISSSAGDGRNSEQGGRR
jgi:hypothetical protein